MFPSHLNFKHLKTAVSITALLTHQGLINRFKKRNNRLVGPCPIHGGDNPSAFVVDLSKNVWYCFTGCQKGGNVIELACSLTGLPINRIARYLAPLSGITPIINEPLERKRYTLFNAFTRKLPLNPTTPLLQGKGITPQTAKLFEVGAYNGRGFLSDCIGVRLYDLSGRPLGYAGRRLDQCQVERYGKWKLPPRFPKNNTIYNFHRVQSTMKKGLVLVECPWAAMRFYQINVPAIALMGISVPPVFYRFLSEISQLVLIFDGDNAGREATTKIKRQLEGKITIHHVTLPTNLDPDDLSDQDLLAIVHPFF